MKLSPEQIAHNERQEGIESSFDKHAGKFVVADFFQLGKVHGKKFSFDVREVIRKGIPVEADYAKHITLNWQDSGRVYVIDEQATANWKNALAEDIQRRKDNEELSKAGEQIAEAITEVAKKSVAKKKGKKE